MIFEKKSKINNKKSVILLYIFLFKLASLPLQLS